MAGRAGDHRAHARQAQDCTDGGMSETTTADVYEATMAVSCLREGVALLNGVHWSAGFHAEPPLPTCGQVRGHAVGQAQGKGRRCSG